MTHFVLETHQLSKSFREVTAVDQIDLQIHAGEVFGFLGPNGAGKTTTIGMALGLIHPSSGGISIFGQPVSPAKTAPLRRVGSLVGAPSLLPYLSGIENLKLLAHLHSSVGQKRIAEVLDLVSMTDAAHRKIKTYSTGMKQRLGLAAALLHQPDLIILDEPTNGLDPAGMREVRELIRQLADAGITVFLSSHLLHEVEQVCDRIAVINKGKIVIQGRVDALLRQQKQVVKLRVPSPSDAKLVLDSLTGIEHVETNGVYVQIRGVASETAVAHLAQHGIIPSEVNTSKSDLEDLFLELTQEK
ncbi:MAG: ABC transporter ATP-binding protein [Chloroflexi bacterium]|nr:ABC transporter ATP-binding protein [Chloroflexota bacterium]